MPARRVLSLAAAAGTVAALTAPQLPALAAIAASTPAISLTAKSAEPVVTGDVWVVWRASKLDVGTLRGTVTGGTAGQVIEIFAQQFPYRSPPAQLGAAIPVTGTSTKYSVQVTPGLATHYRAELLASSSTTPIATSPIVTVYVAKSTMFHGGGPCRQRPVCHQSVRLTVSAPASTLRTERAKRWYVYFGLNLSGTGEPPPPRFLKLGADHPKVSAVRKVSATEFTVTISVSFRIGNKGYYWTLGACTKDSEKTDGLNLPGSHGCGTAKEISRKRVYLG